MFRVKFSDASLQAYPLPTDYSAFAWQAFAPIHGAWCGARHVLGDDAIFWHPDDIGDH